MSLLVRSLLVRATVAALLAVVLPAEPGAVAGESRPAWQLPLDGSLQVVHGFASPARRWERGHRGVDLAGPPGALVRAAGAGTVTYAGVLAGVGVATVTHADGTRTTYQPVTVTVAVRDRVGAGAVLGRLAVAGGHCLPAACLHWGHLRGDVYLDPLLLVRATRARLLPVWDGPARDEGARAGPAHRLHHGARPARSSPRAPPLRAQPASAEASARGPVGTALLLVLAAALLLRPRRQSKAGSSEASRA